LPWEQKTTEGKETFEIGCPVANNLKLYFIIFSDKNDKLESVCHRQMLSGLSSRLGSGDYGLLAFWHFVMGRYFDKFSM
jgi:hypothetical protein